MGYANQRIRLWDTNAAVSLTQNIWKYRSYSLIRGCIIWSCDVIDHKEKLHSYFLKILCSSWQGWDTSPTSLKCDNRKSCSANRLFIPPLMYYMSSSIKSSMDKRVNRLTVLLKDPDIVRRVVIQAKYQVECSFLSNPTTRATLDSLAESSFTEIQSLCDKGRAASHILRQSKRL